MAFVNRRHERLPSCRGPDQTLRVKPLAIRTQLRNPTSLPLCLSLSFSETGVPELLFSCLYFLSFVRHVSGTLTGTFRHSEITPLARNSQNQGKDDIKCRVCVCLKKCLIYLFETGVPELLFSCLSCLSLARHASGGEHEYKAFCQAFYLSK